MPLWRVLIRSSRPKPAAPTREAPSNAPITKLPSTLGRMSSVAISISLLLLGAWLGWFFVAPIPRYEVNSAARLEVDQQIRPVQSPVLARIVTSNLQIGRVVQAGDVLVELDSATERFQV